MTQNTLNNVNGEPALQVDMTLLTEYLCRSKVRASQPISRQ